MPTCPRLRAGQEETGRSPRLRTLSPRCPHPKRIRLSDPPTAHPIPGGPRMLPTERTRGAAAHCYSPDAPGSRQLFPDKEKCSGQRPPGLGAPLSPGRRARARAFTRFIFPSLGAGRQGQRSAPPSLLLHRPVFREVLNSFYPLFSPLSKKIDSEPGVVLLHSTGEFTARAACWDDAWRQLQPLIRSKGVKTHDFQQNENSQSERGQTDTTQS